MATLDDGYKQLIAEFGDVEVSPSVWDRISDKQWKDCGENGIDVLPVKKTTPVAEQKGFEIRPKKFVLMRLVCQNKKLVVTSVGLAEPEAVPITTASTD